MIVADPRFGEPASPVAVASRAGEAWRRRSRGGEPSTVYFAPLAATAQEGRAIKKLFPEATLLTGQRATKAALQRMDAPRMLHIASHGFFLRKEEDGAEDPLLRSGSGARGREPDGQCEWRRRSDGARGVRLEPVGNKARDAVGLRHGPW